MKREIKIENMHQPPTHPGEMLLEEFLKPLDMTQVELAKAIDVPIQRVNEIIRQKRGVSPETALRLSKYFEISPVYWLGLQSDHDLWYAYQKEKVSLDNIAPRSNANSGFNRLLDWLEGEIDSLWELAGTLLEPSLATVRSLPNDEEISKEVVRLYARDGQGAIPENTILSSVNVTDTLAYLIQSTSDEGIRKDAIDLLRSVDPAHTLFDATREKDLSPFLDGQEVALRVMFIPRIDQRYSVVIQIYPTVEAKYLPEGLQLIVVDANDDEKARYSAHARTSLMNRPLILDKGERFGIRIILDKSEINEVFVI